LSGSGSRSRTSSRTPVPADGAYARFVVVLSGPSGVGKSSFVRQLLDGDLDLAYSVSATTRSRRPHEVDGRDYFYIGREDFRRRVEAGEFVEWAEVHGELYGTLRSQTEASLRAGKNVLLDIDVQGGRAVRGSYPDAALIFLLPPNPESLEARLRGRGTDSEDRIRLRLENARREMELASEYDYVVVNDDLEAARRQIASIIIAETCRVSRRLGSGRR